MTKKLMTIIGLMAMMVMATAMTVYACDLHTKSNLLNGL